MTEEQKFQFRMQIMNNIVSHLAFLKKQQWSVAYYCLLLYGGVFAIFNHIKDNKHDSEIMFLSMLLVLIMAAGIIVIAKIEQTMSKQRDEIDTIYDKSKEEYKEINNSIFKTRDYTVLIFLIASLVAGFSTCVWLILR
jgi:hypothetical protein